MGNIKFKITTLHLIIVVSILLVGSLAYLFLKPQSVQVSADDDPFVGPENAKVTVIEFFDFQCPACRAIEPVVEQLRSQYKDRIKFVARDLPISYHQYAQKAAEASECAYEQGKYWEYHDLLMNSTLDTDSLKKYAGDIGLNATQFNDCLLSGKYYSEVQKDYQDGMSYGITGTPTFFVNGEKIDMKSYSDLQSAIERALST